MSNANQHGFRLSAKHDRDLIEELKKYEKSREKTDRIKDLMRKGLELERLIATGQVHPQPAPYSHLPYAAHTPYMYAPVQPAVPPAPPSEAQVPPQAPQQAPATPKQASEAPQRKQEKQEPQKEVTFRMEPPKPVIKEEAKPKEPEPAPPKPQAEAPSEEDQKAALLRNLLSNFD